jgi:hypothetical protein
MRSDQLGGPGPERYADLPFVAEGVDDPSEPPAVLVAYGEDSVAPAATARRTTLSGSSTTSSVRLVVPSIALGLSRLIVTDVPDTQNAALPTASCATMSAPSPTRCRTRAPNAAS